ncbi:MAG TPA: peptidoglycan-binding protein [Chthoniobacterales bacterium]|jgi:hypothetical protein
MKKLLLFTLALALPFALVRADENPPPQKKTRKVVTTSQHAPVTPARTFHPVAAPHVTTTHTVTRAHPAIGMRTEAGAFHPHTVPTSHAVIARRPFNRNSYAIARSRVIRVQHDRAWWTNRYHTRFVLFGGGYYYWNAGYWYPAFGYSPFYNTYAYAQPIYGYDNLPPGQVLENVQSALANQGYYQGPIDGLVGPQTQAALASFQQDHGLAVTSAVDEPTLVTLGLA